MQTPKNRTTAALLALFLGGLGVHHFYLGNTTRGLVYLLFSWTLIPAFAALIEFIMWITMSDDAFAAKYGSGAAFAGLDLSALGGKDTAAQIADWAKLKADGAITDEEYEAKKRSLLGG